MPVSISKDLYTTFAILECAERVGPLQRRLTLGSNDQSFFMHQQIFKLGERWMIMIVNDR